LERHAKRIARQFGIHSAALLFERCPEVRRKGFIV